MGGPFRFWELLRSPDTLKNTTLSGLRFSGCFGDDTRLALPPETKALALNLDDMTVVKQAIQQGWCQRTVISKRLIPTSIVILIATKPSL